MGNMRLDLLVGAHVPRPMADGEKCLFQHLVNESIYIPNLAIHLSWSKLIIYLMVDENQNGKESSSIRRLDHFNED